MEEGIFFVANVHEGSVEAGNHFLHRSEVDIPDGKVIVRRFYMVFKKALILQKGYTFSLLSRIYS